MGNCLSCINRKRQPARNVTLALLGLDSAGKTTLTKVFAGEPLETAPTIGFNKEEIDYMNYHIKMYDLGGGRKIRDIWKDYLNEIYGVIYVVDSSTRERIPEVKENFKNLLEHDEVKGKPLLLLANKQDLPDHMDEVDIMEGLSVEELVNINRCPCRLEMISAIKGVGKKMDVHIHSGMSWLCGMLDQMYDKLKERVDRDMEIVEAKRQKEKEERRERVRKAREERQKKEEEERKRLGIQDEEEEEEEDFVDGDPFRRLTAEEIQRKDEKYTLAKAKEKEKQRRLKELDEKNPPLPSQTVVTENNDDDDLKVPRSSRNIFGGMRGFPNDQVHDISPRLDSDNLIPRSSRQILPPLQSPLGTKFMDESAKSGKTKKAKKKQKNKLGHDDGADVNGEAVNSGLTYDRGYSASHIEVKSKKLSDNEDNDSDTDVAISTGRSKSDKKLYLKPFQGSPEVTKKTNSRKKKNNSSDDEEGFDTLRLSQHLEDTIQEERSNPPSHRDVKAMNEYNEERSSTPVKKLKKKKKHLRKNRTAPSDDEFELSDARSTPSKESTPWAQTASTRSMLSDKETRSTSWGGNVHDVESLQPIPRSRPNLDSEDDLIL